MKSQGNSSQISRIVWALILWIGVPAALFGVGYKLVGPRIGEDQGLKTNVENLISKSTPRDTDTASKSGDPEIDNSKGPDIEVSVEKSNGRRSSREATETKPRKKKKSTRRTSSSSSSGDTASGDGAQAGNDQSRDPASGG